MDLLKHFYIIFVLKILSPLKIYSGEGFVLFFHLKIPLVCPLLSPPQPEDPGLVPRPPSENPKFGQPSPTQRDASLQAGGCNGLSAFSVVPERDVVWACKPLQLPARPPLHTLALMYSLLNTHHIKGPR